MCPLLTHVTIVSVPLVNAIEHLLSGHKNSANSAVLQASEYCARHVGSRNNNILKDILIDILGTIVVGFSKLGNTLLFRTRVHKLNIDAHTPSEGIDDIVDVLLGPAHDGTSLLHTGSTAEDNQIKVHNQQGVCGIGRV